MNILFVGELGYHEDNIIKPIIYQLEKQGHKVTRLGGNFDFFRPNNYKELIKNSVKGIPDDLSIFDIVFFTDFWNFSVPFFSYLKSIQDPENKVKLVGLFHGSVFLENDVARNIYRSMFYEEYLMQFYDKIIVPKEFLRKLLFYNYGDVHSKIRVCNLPLNEQKKRIRPSITPDNNRVIFAHRFEEDKGRDAFLKFVEACRKYRSLRGTEFIICDEGSHHEKSIPGIKFIGRVSQKELKKLCSQGGYAWSSVDSETFGYAIFDLVSYGLTPLLNDHPAYNHFEDCYKYKTIDEAVNKMLKKNVMSNSEWYRLMGNMGDGDKEIAKEITDE